MAGLTAVLVAALLGGVAAIRYGPAVALSASLASGAADRWLARLLPAPTREEIAIGAGERQLRADLYRPARPEGGLLLVHGLSRHGRRHPELVRLAERLARHGQLVLVPEFEGLVTFRLRGVEVEEVARALEDLRRRVGRPAVAGFSFGAGPALIAAARQPDLRLAGSFGGYADLGHVVSYVTTGVHTLGERRYVQPQEEYNRWKLLALLAGFLEEPDRSRLDALATRKLDRPRAAIDDLRAVLGPAGLGVLALAESRDPEQVASRLAALPRSAREAMDRLSPLPAVRGLSARLVVAHGAGDDSIPFTESLRLAAVARGPVRVAILRTFQHAGERAGPRPLWESLAGRAHDAWQLAGVVDALLAN